TSGLLIAAPRAPSSRSLCLTFLPPATWRTPHLVTELDVEQEGSREVRLRIAEMSKERMGEKGAVAEQRTTPLEMLEEEREWGLMRGQEEDLGSQHLPVCLSSARRLVLSVLISHLPADTSTFPLVTVLHPGLVEGLVLRQPLLP